MNEPPKADAGEPSDRAPSDPPSIFSGMFWKTVQDKYDRHTDEHSIIEADAWKKTLGLSFYAVVSKAHKITLGWEHKTVIGGSLSFVAPWENKVNVGAVCNFIVLDKSETTMLNKTEWILGWKFANVVGSKNKFEGSNRMKASLVENGNKAQDENQHIMALEKLLSIELEREINRLEEEHSRVEAIVGKAMEDYKQLEEDIKKHEQKGNVFKYNLPRAQYECDSVLAKYSGKFKSVSDAILDISAKAKLDEPMGSSGKFIGKNLVSIGAALTQAG